MLIVKKIKFPVLATLFTLLLSSPSFAKDGVLINLPDKKFAVISVGDLESASIGSYSIAVFQDQALTEFNAGAVFSRDGSIFDDNGKPRTTFADIDGDGNKELIISKLTAGSGNYLEVDALKITDKNVKLLTRINANSTNNIIRLLREHCKKEQCLKQKQ
ncbi:PliI family lysozyme inhibitor of I-type lysozyme [Xenorhabdus bharatensis]|uniref:PliI family lysozyme inhibitor of I-type lysozyme n=1 Tax=Xenorhabdus bharatensis TaxID=3136256 RepID=UPI0030F3D843